jgi:hypothetical protein
MKVEFNLPTNILSLDGETQPTVTDTPIQTEESKVELELPQSGLQDLEPVGTEENDNEEEELLEEDNTPVDNPYYNTAQSLVDKKWIDLSELEEEDYNFEEWNEKTFGSFIQKAFEARDKREELIAKDASEQTFGLVLEGMSDITRKGFEFEKNNPEIDDVKNFYQQLIYEVDIKSLNPNDSVEAERILEEYYKSLGENLEEARERIGNLKDPISEAIKVKPKLDKKVEDIALSKVEEQNQILAYDLETKKQVRGRVDKIFESKDLDGIPLTPEVKNFLKQVLVDDEVPVTIKGKKVTLSGAEALIRLHKYDTDRGDLKHLMKTIIYLQAPELFEKTIISKIEARETNRKIKESKESAAVKTSTTQLIKPKQSNPIRKTGMVFETTVR